MTARQDLAQFLIKEATGYEVSDFLKLFGSLSSKMQTKLITNDNVSEALRMLSAGDSKIDNMLKMRNAPLKAFAGGSPLTKKLSASCIAMAKRKFKVYPSAYANMYASKQQKKGKC